MNKNESRTKARFLRSSNNLGLKSGVIDNVFIMDFSPKPDIFKILKSYLADWFAECIGQVELCL